MEEDFKKKLLQFLEKDSDVRGNLKSQNDINEQIKIRDDGILRFKAICKEPDEERP